MKEHIREIFIRLGAQICGVANIDMFSSAPEGFNPINIYKDCKSVIVFAKSLPKGIELVNPRVIYNHFNDVCMQELDIIAYNVSIEIERSFGAIAVPIPCDTPYDSWDADKMEGRGTLSMKHAAVHAGLGVLGKSTLLLNSEYGNLLNVGAVLTNLDLPSDEPAKSICKESCQICIDQCPVNAISTQGVDQKLCRNYTYSKNGRGFSVTNCNICRIECPVTLGKK